MSTTETLEALAEPNRRRLLDQLRGGEQPVGALAAALGIRQPSASKHLKALREAGLVSVRADAQRRWYSVRSEPLQELDAWLDPYRCAWAERLDALENHLNTMEE